MNETEMGLGGCAQEVYLLFSANLLLVLTQRFLISRAHGVPGTRSQPLIQIDIEALLARLLFLNVYNMPTKTVIVVTVRASAASA
jgi:hypothetical protein